MIIFSNASLGGKLVDLHVRDSLITAIVPSGTFAPGSVDAIFDLDGMEIYPLMIDVHTHLREPGQEYKEGLESGLNAALLNGISRVAMMANTAPVLDDPDMIGSLEGKAHALGLAQLNINGAATVDQMGDECAPISRYPNCVRAVSDDGHTIRNEGVLRTVFKTAKRNDLVVMSHCENPLNRGFVERTKRAMTLGIPTVTEEDEACIVERNIAMAKETGCRLHICHISSVKGLDAVIEAREEGYPITCEVTPHHIFLSMDIMDYSDGFYKVNPPLRKESTRKFLLDALCKGKIDMIATDHAPHAMEEKRLTMKEAAFGFSGFDSLFLNVYTHLLRSKRISHEEYNTLTSLNPASLLSVPPEMISTGWPASFIVVKDAEYTLKEEDLLSRGKNNPFVGKKFLGRIEMVVKQGRIYRRRYRE